MAVRCDICKIELSSEVVLKEHCTGRKHKRLEQNAMSQKNKTSTSVVVFKLRSFHSELSLYKYFDQFGPVKEVIVDKNRGQFAFVHFKNPETVNQVLKKNNHSISGGIVEVCPAKAKIPNQIPKKDKQNDHIFHQEFGPIFDEMYQQTCVSEQFRILMCRLELTDEEMSRRNNFFRSLQNVIRNYLPNSGFEPYGSSISGLGTHKCDADVFLNVSQVTKDMQRFANIKDKKIGNLIEFALRWNFSSDQRESLQAVKRILSGVCHILRRQIPYVKNIIPILSARCPIVKFDQSAIGLQVDISMTNRLGIVNTELIRFYTMLDTRVRKYLYAVRCFAKRKEIAGDAPSGEFSSYAITMLAIFVLQWMKAPVLPTVEFLRNCADPFEKTILDRWDCTFTTNINNVPRSNNSLSEDELFYQFCNFVSSFSFRDNIICLRSAEILSRDEFSDLMDRHSELKDFKIMKPVCIQDPFDLSHNIAISVTMETMDKITKECHNALVIMNNDNWKPSNQKQCWGFPLLLQQSEELSNTDKK